MNDTYNRDNRAEIGQMPVNLAGMRGHATVVYVLTPKPGYNIESQGRTVFLDETNATTTPDGVLEEIVASQGRDTGAFEKTAD